MGLRLLLQTFVFYAIVIFTRFARQNRKEAAGMKYILPYLRPYRRQTALAMVLVAFATVCDLLLPTIYSV